MYLVKYEATFLPIFSHKKLILSATPGLL